MNNTRNNFANADEYVVKVTATDRRRTAAIARVEPMPGKGGSGVVAVKNIPTMTMVAHYPGQRFTEGQYARRRDEGVTDGKFAVDFWRPTTSGVIRSGYVIDPGNARGGLLPRFAASVAPLVNEPTEGGAPNLLWAWNLPKYRLEYWTLRPVRAGEELTACYGTGGGYVRSYATSCASRPGEVEPELHVVTRPGARPVPHSALGRDGVRAAQLALTRMRR